MNQESVQHQTMVFLSEDMSSESSTVFRVFLFHAEGFDPISTRQMLKASHWPSRPVGPPLLGRHGYHRRRRGWTMQTSRVEGGPVFRFWGGFPLPCERVRVGFVGG